MTGLTTAQYKDVSGTFTALVGADVSGNRLSVHTVTDPNGVAAVTGPLATAAKQDTGNTSLATLVARGGGAGTDNSANAPALPVVGSNFANSGTYANYVLLGTIAANTSRSNVEVNNTTGQQIIVVRDDGTAANGSAPVNASIIPLGPGSAIGAQGGSWTSTTFKGRLQIYALNAGLFVSTYQD